MPQLVIDGRSAVLPWAQRGQVGGRRAACCCDPTCAHVASQRACAAAMRSASIPSAPQAADGLAPVVAEYVAAWEAFDIGRLGPLLPEDVILDEVTFGTAVEGRDAVLTYYRDFCDAFSDISADYVNAFADTYAAAEWVFSGRYTNQLPGLPSSEGQEFAVRRVDILELEGDTITVIRESRAAHAARRPARHDGGGGLRQWTAPARRLKARSMRPTEP